MPLRRLSQERISTAVRGPAPHAEPRIFYPASVARHGLVALAGLRKMHAEGVVREDERVACILTGHVLKDPDVILAQKDRIAARLIEIEPTLDAVQAALNRSV